ncbi:kinase-like domain-containing protein [Rhizophagus clarus]|uniref:Kinase-like domain-containing protein n=1 Tax=Rhizophagus clarus TaxID=94130 RepID=A0A8H3QX86_9GLOM|nr:kinase-like domain-containing protein [Rhizophagus clarus]
MPKTQNTKISRTQIAIGKGKISQEKILSKRASLPLAQKHEICLKKATEPSIKNKELAKLFDVSEGCISNTLKNSQKWLEINLQAPEAKGKRQVKAIFPEIEEALILWIMPPVHTLYEGVELTNIEIKFLPPNTTAYLQPYDKDDTDSQDGIEENEHEEMDENERSEIQGLIDKLEYTYPLTAEEYIRIDQENEIDGETPTEEQIVAILKEPSLTANDHKIYSYIAFGNSEVLAAFDKIFIYLEQNNNQNIIDKSAFKAMKKARREVYRNNFFLKKQMSLDLFVKSNNSIDGIGNMNREGVKDNIIDVDNINFETSYFNERDIYNHEEEYKGFIEYQIDQDSLYNTYKTSHQLASDAEKAFDVFIDLLNKYFNLIEDITNEDVEKTLIRYNIAINMNKEEAEEYNTVDGICFAKILILFSLKIPNHKIQELALISWYDFKYNNLNQLFKYDCPFMKVISMFIVISVDSIVQPVHVILRFGRTNEYFINMFIF